MPNLLNASGMTLARGDQRSLETTFDITKFPMIKGLMHLGS